MLTILRNSVGSWASKIFLLLLVASFAVWGVSGGIITGVTGSVIQVGDTRVSANDYALAYERARYGLSQQFGRLLSREEARVFGIENNVVNQLMSGAVLDESARKMGLGLSNKNLAALIGEDETFQDPSGNFNRQALQQQLYQLRLTEADYVQNRQAVAVRNQLLEGISANAKTPQAFIDAYNAYRNEKRVFDYVVLSADLLPKALEPTSDDLKAYYDKNKASYRAPEYRKLTVVKLEAEDIKDAEGVSQDEIKADYEKNKQSYTDPEKRTIQQINLESEDQGKKLIEKLSGGADFATVLEEIGKKEEEVTLGDFAQKDLPDANVANAVFALEEGKVSEVVNGIFGPVLLRVTKITPETVKPLEDVEKEIRERIALDKASEELFDIHDKLEDERAAGDSLTEAAAKVNLKPRIIERIDAQGKDDKGETIADIPQSAKVISEAFQTAEGVETDPVSLNNSGFVWYEVNEIISDRQKEQKEVEEQIKTAWIEENTSKAVEKIATELQSKLASGGDFASLVAELKAPANSEATDGTENNADAEKGLKIEKSAEMSREDTSDELGRTTVQAGFAIEKDKSALAAGAKKGTHVVLRVADVINSESNTTGPDEIKRLDEAVSNDLLSQLIGDLREKETVTVNQSAINAAQHLIR